MIKRKIKRMLLGYGVFLFFLFTLTIGVLLLFTDEEGGLPDLSLSDLNLSEEVLRWESEVTHWAKHYDIEDWIMIILAIMQVESGGLLPDLMQSSESAGLPVNTLQYEASIEQGVKHLARIIEQARALGIEQDQMGIIQAYNFGFAYINHLGTLVQVHTLDISEAYSREVVAPSLGNLTGERIDYNNPVAVANGRPYRYLNGGNFHYAFVVLQYIHTPIIEGIALPLEPPFRVTCDFYCYAGHRGVDLSKAYGAPVKSVMDGTVTRVDNHFGSNSGWFGSLDGYGNVIFIEHGEGIVTVYAHLMETTLVQVGQQVKSGQTIGFQGNSGNSSGTHLHLEWLENGVPINPELRIQLR